MLELFSTSGLLSAVIALLFGFIVLLKDPRSLSGQIFSLMTVAFALWGFSYWQWLTAGDMVSALIWVKLLTIGTFLTPALFTHWIVVLFNKEKNYIKTVWVIYAISLIAVALAPTAYIVNGLEQKLLFPFWPNAGILYLPSVLVVYLCALIPAFKILLEKVREGPQSLQRGQALYILIGSILGFGGGYTNVFLWFDIPIPPYGTVFAGFFPFLLAYSVIKHRLFKLKAIASELLIVFIAGVLFIQLIFSETTTEYILRAIFFGMSVIMGFVLVKSVYREVEQREQIERLAHDLKVANERLKELDTLKSQFLSIASHDLRAPLTAIRNFMSLLLDGTFGKLPAGAQSGVQQVFDRATDMASMVDNYLNVSRIEQGRMKYDFTEVNLTELITKTVESFVNVAKEKGLTITLRPIRETFMMKGDASKLREVFENLINNGILYTERGTITVSAERDGSKLRITFADTGVGMSKETIGKLFQLFSPGDDSRKYNPKSTGVGLYISKAHVVAHRGSVRAESDGVGKGSRFIVELPLS